MKDMGSLCSEKGCNIRLKMCKIEYKKRMKKKSHWFVYIIQAQSGKFYTGITNDLKRRLKEHQSGCRGARFFHFSSPEKIVYHEIHPNRSKASLREWEIKKLSREQKLVLIQSSSSDEF